MKPSEAIKLIMRGARVRGKSIPADVLDTLLHFETAVPGIQHPLFKKLMHRGGIDGRDHIARGKTILLVGPTGCGKTATACCIGLLTAGVETICMSHPIGLKSEWRKGEMRIDEDTGREYRVWYSDIEKPPQFSYYSAMDYLDSAFKKKKGAPDPKEVPHLLILDDFGHEHAPVGKYNYKRLSELILYRRTKGFPTIIISNKMVQEIRNDYAEHIVSRLFDKEHTKLVECWELEDMRSES